MQGTAPIMLDTAKLEVECVPVEAISAADWALWRNWIAADPALRSPYFRPEFNQIAARISPDAAVALFRRGGRTVGFFPHQRRGGAVQPLAAPMNDYHGMIAAPGERILPRDVLALMKPRRLNLSAWTTPAEGLSEKACVQAVLPASGFDAWYAERRTTFGKFFKDKERARRSLETELGEIRVERGIRDPRLLDQLIDLKREQYRRTGRHDVFACGWTADLLHALMREQRDGFGASMAVLWAGGKRVAMEYSMHAGDQYHFWFPAYEPTLARCSPGILLSMDTMRLAAEDGYRVFDFGPAGEHYKKYFHNAVQMVGEGVLLSPGVGAAVSQAAVGVIDAVAKGKAERLRTSIRRRWAAIEACETSGVSRLRGAAIAARDALAKSSRAVAGA